MNDPIDKLVEENSITKIIIYGERCSGTSYLQELIINNFDITITWEYGYKHFFGFEDLTNSKDTLFIGIIRNPYDWINSFCRVKHHLPKQLSKTECFLNDEFYSVYDNGQENMKDRNIYTKERYKNIFDMRNTKNKFLIDDMPLLVKNYMLITYDNLVNDFNNIMNEIKNKGLIVKNNIEFPLNITYYQWHKDIPFVKNVEKYISKEEIKNKLNMYYEEMLFKDLYTFD